MVASNHIANGCDARKWIDYCTSAVGAGKGGGKDLLAMASIPLESRNVDEVFAIINNAAIEYTSTLN
jgi:hypothetical protein